MKSPALKALAIDSFMDVGITVTSVVSFAVSARIDYAADAIVGIVISIAVIVFAIKAVRDNIKAVVSGDGANDEKEAIYKECEKVGVTVVKPNFTITVTAQNRRRYREKRRRKRIFRHFPKSSRKNRRGN